MAEIPKTEEKTLKGMSDEKLEKLSSDLAETRTQVRLAQNAVASEIEIRRALAAMSPETRRVINLRLGGEIAPSGSAEVEK